MSQSLKHKSVQVNAEEYYNLLKAADELSALDEVGVDNWGDYGEHRLFMKDERELLELVKNKLTSSMR